MPHTHARCRSLLAVFAMLLSAAGLAADTPCEVARLASSSDKALPGYGSDTDLHGDVLVIGSRRDRSNEAFPGAAHVYRRSGTSWLEEAMLLAPDADEGNGFGSAVATSGDRVFVNGRREADGFRRGAVYVYAFVDGGWEFETRLEAGDDEDRFGHALDASGDALLVGDPAEAGDTGVVHVLRRSDGAWVEEATLAAAGGQPDDRFGEAVALDGAVALIGAPDAGEERGAAFVFRRLDGTWAQEARLEDQNAEPDDSFGRSVAVQGDRALVGATHLPGDCPAAEPDSGSATVFRYADGAWSREAVLCAAGSGPDDAFGYDVALDGNRALVGAPIERFYTGAAYLFRYESGWHADGQLAPAGPRGTAYIGFGVELEDDVAVVVSAKLNERDRESGTASIFDLAPPDCNRNGIADCADIDSGASSDCNGNGVPDECETVASAEPVGGRRLEVPAAFPDIQSALDAAVDGDEVVIADGVYTGPGNRNLRFRGKEIAVRSESCDPALCVIDCEGAARGFLFDGFETVRSHLSGVTIVNAYGAADEIGGAIFCGRNSNPTIRSCVFERCVGEVGGGVGADDASPRIIDCTFVDNYGEEGGAVYATAGSFIDITGCSFSGNARHGILVSGNAFIRVRGCDFTRNLGPAILCAYSAEMEIDGCTFLENTSEGGSGLRLLDAQVTVTDCFFLHGSVVDGAGAAIKSQDTDAVITRSTFIGNRAWIGGAIMNVDSDPVLTDCVFRENWSSDWGGAIYNARSSRPTIERCVFADNSAQDFEGGAVFSEELAAIVNDSRFCGNRPDDISGPFEGSGNVFETTCDVCPGDVDGDGVVDTNDLLVVLATWGPCADCPSDLDENGRVDFADLIIVLAGWGSCE